MIRLGCRKGHEIRMQTGFEKIFDWFAEENFYVRLAQILCAGGSQGKNLGRQ